MKGMSRLQAVTTDDLHRIHEKTLYILEKTGVIFHSDEIAELFRKHGATVEGHTVKIPPHLVEKALQSAPSSFHWQGRDTNKSVHMGPEQEQAHVMLDNGPVAVLNPDNETKRAGTLEDNANFYRLAHHFDVTSIVGQIPVDPGDCDQRTKHLDVFYELLKNTDKPLLYVPLPPQESDQVFEMFELATEQGYLADNYCIGNSVCAYSPLQFSDESCHSLLAYARWNQPIMVLSCCMSGVTSPISPIGTAIVQNAEILAGIVMMQLARPGIPVVYSPASTVANMRTGGYVTGSPEANLINLINLQLAQELYNLPTRCMAGLTDAKVNDCQAGYETMQNLFTLLLANCNAINECIGTLDSIMTISYGKFITDIEMIERVLRYQKGVIYDELDFDTSVIEAVGHTSTYLMQPCTVEQCHSMWSPRVSDWNSFDDWKLNGAQNIAAVAEQKCQNILAELPETQLSPDQEKALQAYVAKQK